VPHSEKMVSDQIAGDSALRTPKRQKKGRRDQWGIVLEVAGGMQGVRKIVQL